MADWLHCNTCFCQPGEGIKFLLTNCGHMYCEECMTKMSGTGICCMCKSTYTTTPMTNAEMSPENAVFLSNPMELLDSNFEKLQKTLKVMEFQQRHRQRFTAHLREKVVRLSHVARTSYQRMKEYEVQITKLRDENTFLKKKYSENDRQVGLLKEEIAYMKKVWGKGGSTPGRTSPRTSPVIVTMASTAPRNRSSPLPTQSETTTPKSYLTSLSPSSQYGKNISQICYKSPNVTTGRVLVRTPPYIQSRSGMHPGTHPSWSGLHTPASVTMKRPATPSNTRGSPCTSPMDLGKDSPQGPGSSQTPKSQSQAVEGNNVEPSESAQSAQQVVPEQLTISQHARGNLDPGPPSKSAVPGPLSEIRVHLNNQGESTDESKLEGPSTDIKPADQGVEAAVDEQRVLDHAQAKVKVFKEKFSSGQERYNDEGDLHVAEAFPIFLNGNGYKCKEPLSTFTVPPKEIMMLDFDNKQDFFKEEKLHFPDNCLVLVYFGGNTTWKSLKKHKPYKKCGQGHLHVHKFSRKEKNAADMDIYFEISGIHAFYSFLQVGQLHKLLHRDFMFSIISGDKDFRLLLELCAGRNVQLINPHDRSPEGMYSRRLLNNSTANLVPVDTVNPVPAVTGNSVPSVLVTSRAKLPVEVTDGSTPEIKGIQSTANLVPVDTVNPVPAVTGNSVPSVLVTSRAKLPVEVTDGSTPEIKGIQSTANLVPVDTVNPVPAVTGNSVPSVLVTSRAKLPVEVTDGSTPEIKGIQSTANLVPVDTVNPVPAVTGNSVPSVLVTSRAKLPVEVTDGSTPEIKGIQSTANLVPVDTVNPVPAVTGNSVPSVLVTSRAKLPVEVTDGSTPEIKGIQDNKNQIQKPLKEDMQKEEEQEHGRQVFVGIEEPLIEPQDKEQEHASSTELHRGPDMINLHISNNAKEAGPRPLRKAELQHARGNLHPGPPSKSAQDGVPRLLSETRVHHDTDGQGLSTGQVGAEPEQKETACLGVEESVDKQETQQASAAKDSSRDLVSSRKDLSDKDLPDNIESSCVSKDISTKPTEYVPYIVLPMSPLEVKVNQNAFVDLDLTNMVTFFKDRDLPDNCLVRVFFGGNTSLKQAEELPMSPLEVKVNQNVFVDLDNMVTFFKDRDLPDNCLVRVFFGGNTSLKQAEELPMSPLEVKVNQNVFVDLDNMVTFFKDRDLPDNCLVRVFFGGNTSLKQAEELPMSPLEVKVNQNVFVDLDNMVTFFKDRDLPDNCLVRVFFGGNTSLKQAEELPMSPLEVKVNQNVFVDLDNMVTFFKDRDLPDNCLVRVFFGGNTSLKQAEECDSYRKCKDDKRLVVHEFCGKEKNATDVAIILEVGRLDERLDKDITFTVVSRDKDFVTLINMFRHNPRKVRKLNPHDTDPETFYDLLKDVSSEQEQKGSKIKKVDSRSAKGMECVFERIDKILYCDACKKQVCNMEDLKITLCKKCVAVGTTPVCNTCCRKQAVIENVRIDHCKTKYHHQMYQKKERNRTDKPGPAVTDSFTPQSSVMQAKLQEPPGNICTKYEDDVKEATKP